MTAPGSLPIWVYLSSTKKTESSPKEVVDLSTYSTTARITPKGITTFLVRRGGPGNPDSLVGARAKLQAHGFNGEWSPRMKAKVRRIAENWLFGSAAFAGDVWTSAAIDAASRRYTLLTLTLSAAQVDSDQEVRRKMLRPFLQELGRKHNVLNYMWFAEKQGNGSIHFHLVLDRYVDMKKVRLLWNAVQERHGYIEQYRAGREAWHAGGFRYDPADAQGRNERAQLLAYNEGLRTSWAQPNSTDIRHVEGAGAVVSYVVEYCSKGAKGAPGAVHHKLEGRLWGCNQELARLSRYEVEMTPELHQLIEAHTEAGALRLVEGERWKHFGGDVGRMLAYELPHLYHGFRSHWRAERMKLPSRRGKRRAGRTSVPVPLARAQVRSLKSQSSGHRSAAR